MAVYCIVTALTHGADGTRALLRRYLLWRVGFRWYLAAIVGPFALYSVAVLLCRLLGGPPADTANTLAAGIFGTTGNLWLLIIPFFLVDAITNGEELAWRGFVLPRYQARLNALTASVIVGAIWGVWHLPKLASAGEPQAIIYAILHNVALAVLLTWIYDSTGGSLLLATLFHAAFNTAYVFLPVAPTAPPDTLIQVSVLVVEYLAAATVVVAGGLAPSNPPARLSGHRPAG